MKIHNLTASKSDISSVNIQIEDRDAYYKAVTLAFIRTVSVCTVDVGYDLELAVDNSNRLVAFYKDLNLGYEFEFLIIPRFNFKKIQELIEANVQWTSAHEVAHEISNNLFYNVDCFLLKDSVLSTYGRKLLIQFGADKFIVDIILRSSNSVCQENPYLSMVKERFQSISPATI